MAFMMRLTVSGLSGLTKAYTSVRSAYGSPAIMGASRWLEAPAGTEAISVPASRAADTATPPARARGRFIDPGVLLSPQDGESYDAPARSDQSHDRARLLDWTGAEPVNRQHLTWTQIEDLAIRLADRLPATYDVMLVITRGGMVPACIISERLNLRNILVAAVMFYTGQEHTLEKPILLQFPADPLLNGRRVLIVDDVWDSGRTIMAVRERVLDAGGYPATGLLPYQATLTR